MNNFFTLTKVFFLSGFNVNSKKKNQKSALGLFGLTLVLFAISSLGISFSMIMMMKEASLPIELFLCVLVMMGFMLNFIIYIFQLQSIIFNTKDYELLESLPISKPCIIVAKLFATYLINVAEDVALILPALGIYFANGGTIVPGILSFVSALLISVVPILLSAIIGSISALISAKSRHSNLINIILSLLFFVVFFGGYFYINYAGADMLTGVLDHVFFLKWMKDALLSEYINYLYFVLFNLGGAIILTLMISLIYRPVNTWLKTGVVHVDYDKVKKNNEKVDLNLDKVLLKKEWNMVSRRPQYLINCVLGQFFFLIFAIMFILLPNMFVGGSEEIPESLPPVFAMLVALM
jgi:ABC-2 type transport system permease protein